MVQDFTSLKMSPRRSKHTDGMSPEIVMREEEILEWVLEEYDC